MEEQHLLTARRFEVKRVKQSLGNGGTIQREVVRHPGSVVIVPRIDELHVCLIRNFRVAVGKSLLELPAGTLENDEPPQACAARELTEETGYRAQSVRDLGGFYAAPGILDEYMHLFVADELTEGEPAREEGEEIENLVVTWSEAFDLIRTGQIEDAKTIVGLMRCYHELRSDS